MIGYQSVGSASADTQATRKQTTIKLSVSRVISEPEVSSGVRMPLCFWATCIHNAAWNAELRFTIKNLGLQAQNSPGAPFRSRYLSIRPMFWSGSLPFPGTLALDSTPTARCSSEARLLTGERRHSALSVPCALVHNSSSLLTASFSHPGNASWPLERKGFAQPLPTALHPNWERKRRQTFESDQSNTCCIRDHAIWKAREDRASFCPPL